MELTMTLTDIVFSKFHQDDTERTKMTFIFEDKEGRGSHVTFVEGNVDEIEKMFAPVHFCAALDGKLTPEHLVSTFSDPDAQKAYLDGLKGKRFRVVLGKTPVDGVVGNIKEVHPIA